MALISPRKLRYDLYSPQSEESDAAPPLVISVLASLIERAIARNEKVSGKTNNNNCCRSIFSRTRVFDAIETPDMTVQSYLERIFRYTGAAPSVYVLAYVYIDRFCQDFPEFRMGSTNVHRLLITTIMVASKYVEDLNYRNSYYAKVGGLSRNEMNKLEIEFLTMMKFKIHVKVSVFESYCRHLEREVGIGGGYQIERALRCAEEIKIKQLQESNYDQLLL